MISVYVAASSGEIGRAFQWTDRLRNKGIFVTSTWTEVILSYGANPSTATYNQRNLWAKQDLAELQNASVFWLLVPNNPSRGGSSVELGFAYAMNKKIISSGNTKQTIFTSLGMEFEQDDAACEFISHLNNQAP